MLARTPTTKDKPREQSETSQEEQAPEKKDKQEWAVAEKKFRKRFNLKESQSLISWLPARLAGKTGYGTMYLSPTNLWLFVDQFSVTKIAIHFADIASVSCGTDLSVTIKGSKTKTMRFEFKESEKGAKFSQLFSGLWQVYCQQIQDEQKFSGRAALRDRTKSGHTRVKSISEVRHHAREVSGGVPVLLDSFLKEKEFLLLQRFGDTEEYKDNETIIREGETNTKFIRIVEGLCDIMVTHNGTLVPLDTLKAGDFIAEASLFGAKSPVTVVANGNVTLLSVKSEYVNLLFAKFPDFPHKFFTHVAIIVLDRLEFLLSGKVTAILNNKTQVTKIQTTMTALDEIEEGEGTDQTEEEDERKENVYKILGEEDGERSAVQDESESSETRSTSSEASAPLRNSIDDAPANSWKAPSIPLRPPPLAPAPPTRPRAQASNERKFELIGSDSDSQPARPKFGVRATDRKSVV